MTDLPRTADSPSGRSETVADATADAGGSCGPAPLPRHWNRTFWTLLLTFGAVYLLLIISMVVADFRFAQWDDLQQLWSDPRVRYSTSLSLISCTISAILSLWFAVPIGYFLARGGRDAIDRRWSHRPALARFLHAIRAVLDSLFDIPIVLPPMVVGISLLVLFQLPAGRWLDEQVGQWLAWLGYPGIRGITYEVPAVILAQFTVAAAFAIRTMRDTFEQIPDRPEQVALTLGASHAQVFSWVALPQAWRGMVAAGTLAWARSLGEFGPVLIFAGTSRMKTEVLSTTVYLNFQFGNLRGAVAASILLVGMAMVVLVVTRVVALGRPQREGRR